MKVKHGHTWWHRKLDGLLGSWMRETFTNCAMCGRFSESLQVSHILPKGTYPHLRYDPINILPMDGQCHQFRWHANPTESGKWFQEKYPVRWIYLQEAKNLFIKRNEVYYNQILEALKSKDMKKLNVLGSQIGY